MKYPYICVKAALFSALFFIQCFSAYAQNSGSGSSPVISAGCEIDWTKKQFYSAVRLDVEKAKIPFPSGKNSAVNKVNSELPQLIKDQLLSLAVDSSDRLGDLVINETLSLDKITSIIDSSKRTPGVFTDGVIFQMNDILELQTIASLMTLHKHSYQQDEPVESISSRPYTGIIIDARGSLPVQGEFLSDTAKPCFFPEIWDEDMNLIYERNMMDGDTARAEGIIAYDYSDDETRYKARIGADPMHIIAAKLYGQNRTDPVISREDALRILTVPENRKLLEEGKIVVLLDKERLVYAVTAPVKDDAYYAAFREAGSFLYTDKVPGVELLDTYKGILVQVDLKFVADSPQLLASEKGRMAKIAELLKQITQNNEFNILVEGHTADVGKPAGQKLLSIQRSKTVIDTLVADGVPRNLFTYEGYGATKPIASNATAEGRAQNRRVDITATPKATYIQRN